MSKDTRGIENAMFELEEEYRRSAIQNKGSYDDLKELVPYSKKNSQFDPINLKNKKPTTNTGEQNLSTSFKPKSFMEMAMQKPNSNIIEK
jgi:hypothetical protein